MRHYFDAVLHPSTGAALEGVLVRIFDENDALVDIYADANSTPIETVSGEANAAVTDADGMFSLYVGEGAYTVRFYQGDTVLKTITNVNLGIDVTRIELADTTGAVLVGDVLPGTGPVAGTVADKLAALVPFEDFLPKDYDYTIDDASIAMEAAAVWSATNNATVTFSKRYRLANNVTITDDNVRFHFDGAQFDVLDTDTTPTITSGASGPIGILFKEADYSRVTGSARLIGQGVEGSTRLAGVVFDTCDYVTCSSDLYLENMAAGRMVMWCDHGQFGDIQAHKMNGTQTYAGTGTAGSAEVVIGCRFSKFGKIASTLNYKPIRYLSIAADASATAIDNQYCHFGFVTGTSAVASAEGSVTSVRSAYRCTFEGGSGTGFSVILYLIRYSTDAGWSVDGNDLGDWSGTLDNTAASVDAGLQVSAETGVAIGRNRVRSLSVTAEDVSGGAEYGILATAGDTYVEKFRSDGFTYAVQFHSCSLKIGEAVVANPALAAFRYGLGISGWIRKLDIITGTVASGRSSMTEYSGSIGTGAITNFTFERIDYNLNATGNDVLFAFFDATNSPNVIRVNEINGTGSTGAARWLTEAYTVKRGRLLKASIPTTATWAQGDIVYNSGAAASGKVGWVCVAAGTPGTWKAFGAIDA